MTETGDRKDQETVKGFSIWLTPSAAMAHQIQSTIDALSSRFNSPVFQPHVTLIGQLEGDQQRITGTFNRLGTGIHSFILEVTGIGFQDVFFRSMFYKLAESDQLMALNQQACERYGRETDQTYFPHLSLLYSHKNKTEKKAAVESLNPQCPDRITIAGIALVKTHGEVGEWELVKRIELS